jgi:hypothetical protein
MSRYAELRERAEKAEARNRQQEFSSWLSSDAMRLKISPAMKPELLELLEFAAATEAYEFSAPDPQDPDKTVKTKQAPAEKVKAFMQRHLPDIISFGEAATKKKAAGERPVMTDAVEISNRALQFQKSEADAGRVITITEAVNHVTKS